MQGQFSDLIRQKIVDSQSRELPASTRRDVHVPQVRGKVVRTTVADATGSLPSDKVKRQFRAERPNQLWLSDFT